MTGADPRITNLDGVAREFAREAGYDAGERLVLHYAGQRVFVPQQMRPRSELWVKLGPIAAKILSRMFGSTTIGVPTGENLARRKRVAQVRALLAGAGKGSSKNEVAKQLHIHRRTVQRHRAWLDRQAHRRQGQLDLYNASRPRCSTRVFKRAEHVAAQLLRHPYPSA